MNPIGAGRAATSLHGRGLRSRGARRPARRSEWWYRALRVLSVAALLGAWQLFGGQSKSGLDFFPPLSQVARAFVDLLGQSAFWSAAADTVEVLLIGYALTVVAGVLIGVVMGSRRMARRAMRPLVSIFLATPIAPLVPILIIIFGIGAAARVATVFILATPILVENTAASVAAIPQRLVQMGRSFGANERQLTGKVVIPAALPGIMAGLRLAAGRAVVGMVVGELIIASAGLGQLIRLYSATFDAPDLYATVAAVLLIGVATVQIVRTVERRATRWRQ